MGSCGYVFVYILRVACIPVLNCDHLFAHVSACLCLWASGGVRVRMMHVGVYTGGKLGSLPMCLTPWIPADRVRFLGQHTLDLENWIDRMDQDIPPLKNFILPVLCKEIPHSTYPFCW